MSPHVYPATDFHGLYRALSVDIELRQSAVSGSTDWASNLAAPDMFLFWGDWLWDYLSGRGTGWLGPYFNLLPVLVVILFLTQQKLFMPPATDEQTAMFQKMMNIMTFMMGLFFSVYPRDCASTSSPVVFGEFVKGFLLRRHYPKRSILISSLYREQRQPQGHKRWSID